MAQVILPTGEQTDLTPKDGKIFSSEELAAFNKVIGCAYLEAISLTAEKLMYFDENGIQLRLAPNPRATALVQGFRPDLALYNGVIRGTVIIATLQETGDAE